MLVHHPIDPVFLAIPLALSLIPVSAHRLPSSAIIVEANLIVYSAAAIFETLLSR